MENPPLHPSSSQSPSPSDAASIQQQSESVQGQAIAQMTGGLAVGQLTVYLSQVHTEATTPASPTTTTDSSQLGGNPYQGLLAFQETDGDRFFGREAQIDQLWHQFRQLYDAPTMTRILTIYGPSGSGKSSLARAGLVHKLGDEAIPGYTVARVVSLVPGTHPIEALSTVLARIVTQDAAPVAKKREFTEELLHINEKGEFDGLRRIADAFPKIDASPLIILVDQFEEIYTLCSDGPRRDAFVANLLHAASDRTQHLSVILTLRSDFLGETQQHLTLNALITEQGYLVPMMQPEELKGAIAEPAKRAGHELDPATIQLLVEQTQGRQGTLPLLQVALKRMWEELKQGYHPLETLEKVGGVGGALADEAQRLYQNLNEEERAIAPRIFVALVQLDAGSDVTRRRTTKSELITSESDVSKVEAIINRFAAANVRFLVTSFDKEQGEMVEVAHEALLRSWDQLKEWIAEYRDALRQKHKIDRAAQEWVRQGKSNGYLLQGRPLQDAKVFMKTHEKNRVTALSRVAIEFVNKGLRNKRRQYLSLIGFILSIPGMGTLFLVHTVQVNRADALLRENKNCIHNAETRDALKYMWWAGKGQELREIDLCGQVLPNIILTNSDLSGSNLEGIDLNGANLEGTIFGETDFQNATLITANLTGSVIARANMKEIKLQGAILENASLVNVNLQGAKLSHTSFLNAYIEGVDFRNSDGLTLEQIREAKKACNIQLGTDIANLYGEEIRVMTQKCVSDE